MKKFHRYSRSSCSRPSKPKDKNKLYLSKTRQTSTNMTEFKCQHCQESTAELVRKRLARCYNQSERYSYSKDVNELLDNGKSHIAIYGRDVMQYHQISETLQSYYPAVEYEQHLGKACQYFRYFRDLPRSSMDYYGEVVRKYYDNYRLLEYQRLKHLLMMEGVSEGSLVCQSSLERERKKEGGPTDIKNKVGKQRLTLVRKTAGKQDWVRLLEPSESPRAILVRGEKVSQKMEDSLRLIRSQLSAIVASVPSGNWCTEISFFGQQSIESISNCSNINLCPKQSKCSTAARQQDHPHPNRRRSQQKSSKHHSPVVPSLKIDRLHELNPRGTEVAERTIRRIKKKVRKFQSECNENLRNMNNPSSPANRKSQPELIRIRTKGPLRYSESDINALLKDSKSPLTLYNGFMGAKVRRKTNKPTVSPYCSKIRIQTAMSHSPFNEQLGCSSIPTMNRMSNMDKISSMRSQLQSRQLSPTPVSATPSHLFVTADSFKKRQRLC